jgi:hypothetical protein
VDIVILHCHFERGGVTQVVENHVRAMSVSDEIDRIFLVSDERVGGLSPETRRLTEQIRLPGFDYDPTDLPAGSALSRAEAFAEQLIRELDSAAVHPHASVLHWHNHSLGKNTAAPAVVRRLAASGWRLLLQIHDFAEDNRPENYCRLIEASGASSGRQIDDFLYPVAPQIHYATLTGGDAGVLTELGIPSDRTHCLPNSVVLPSDPLASREQSLDRVRRAMSLPDDSRWCLYPVRGIRRKNVGEFLLLCRWLPDDCFGGLTLRPTTPLEERSYDRWQRIAGETSPRVVFDAAHHAGVTFADNLAASDFVLSTSVAEGFGMAFLEPWLAERPVVARRLAGVTEDFESSGVQLPDLYSAIPVAGNASWLADCRLRIADAFEKAWAAVPEQFRPPADSVADQDSQTIDFGRLTPSDQVDVLRRVSSDSQFESEIKKLSGPLIDSLGHPSGEEVIRANGEVVARHYCTESQGRQLRRIYGLLLEADIEPSPMAATGDDTAVNLVSRQRPFYPCRTETQIEE